LLTSIVLVIFFKTSSVFKEDDGDEQEFESVIEIEPNTNVEAISLTDYSNTAIGVAEKVLPSIVGINVEYNVTSMFYRNYNSTGKASGSGIIISEDGYILTNNHIVNTSSTSYFYEVTDATKVTVKLYNDETEYEAKIIGKDEQTDLAVIKIEKTGLTKAEFGDATKLKIGEFAMAIGNPLGLDSTVTCGIISGKNREIESTDGTTYNLIQTDAAINSGNSGGALVNSTGQVIGINTLKLAGSDVEGMGFAIPINDTVEITNQLIKSGKVVRPSIGIGGIDIDEETAKQYKLEIGIYVKEIQNFSPAEKAGLKIGDVIIKINDKKVSTVDELNEIKNTYSVGDTIILTVIRDKEEKEIEVKLGEQ